MASIPANPDGWIIKVPLKGLEPDTRGMEQLFAVWESDPVNACRLVEQKEALTNDRIPETHAELTEGQLLGIGLRQPGDVHMLLTQA